MSTRALHCESVRGRAYNVIIWLAVDVCILLSQMYYGCVYLCQERILGRASFLSQRLLCMDLARYVLDGTQQRPRLTHARIIGITTTLL
jgi:hypothetical protein